MNEQCLYNQTSPKLSEHNKQKEKEKGKKKEYNPIFSVHPIHAILNQYAMLVPMPRANHLIFLSCKDIYSIFCRYVSYSEKESLPHTHIHKDKACINIV